MRTCAYYEYIIHIFMISHGRQLYLMRFILYASIYENTIRTDYCVHRNINRIVYNYSWLHTNQFHSSSYTPSAHALINIVFSYNLCVHVYIMSTSSIPSWHHENMNNNSENTARKENGPLKVRWGASRIENSFARFRLKALHVGNGLAGVGLKVSRNENAAAEFRVWVLRVENSSTAFRLKASKGRNRPAQSAARAAAPQRPLESFPTFVPVDQHDSPHLSKQMRGAYTIANRPFSFFEGCTFKQSAQKTKWW